MKTSYISSMDSTMLDSKRKKKEEEEYLESLSTCPRFSWLFQNDGGDFWKFIKPFKKYLLGIHSGQWSVQGGGSGVQLSMMYKDKWDAECPLEDLTV